MSRPRIITRAESIGPVPNEWKEQQKKVYLKWLNFNLERGKEDPLASDDITQALQDPNALGRLIRALSKKELGFALGEFKSANQMFKIERAKNVLEFIKNQELLDGDETMVLGLVWLLILKYQNIQDKNALLNWVKDRLKQYGADIKNMSENFQDGMGFASLVHSFAPHAIDLQAVEKMAVLDRLETAFSAAHEHLGVPRLLEPSDCYPNKPSDQVVMAYLSYFRNESLSQSGEVLKSPSKPAVVTVMDSAELDKLKAEIESLKSQLAEKTATNEALETTNKGLIEKDIPELKAALESTQQKFHSNQQELVSVQQQVTNAEQEKIKLKQHTEQQIEKIGELEKIIPVLKQDIQTKDRERTETVNMLQQLRTAVAELTPHAPVAAKKTDGDDDPLIALTNDLTILSELKTKVIPSLNQAITAKDADIEELKRKLANAESSASASAGLNASLEELKKKVSAYESKDIPALKSDIQERDMEVTKLTERVTSYEKTTVPALEKSLAESKASEKLLRAELQTKDDELEQLRVRVLSFEQQTVPTLEQSLKSAQDDAQQQKLSVLERDEIITKLESMLAQSRADARASSASSEEVNQAMRELNEIVSQRDKEITRVQKELDMLVSIEIPKLTDAVEARDQEIAALREKNKALIAQMKIELMKLLDKQKADCEAIDTLKQKVASYSSKIVELQGQIAEYGMADAAALEAELNKLSLMNEQLQSKLAEMEKEMLEATRKAESLMSSLKEADEDEPEREISLQEKIDAAAKEIEGFMTWKKKITGELDELRVRNEEATALLATLDRMLKESSRKIVAVDQRSRVLEEQQLVFKQSRNDTTIELRDVIDWNLKKLDVIKGLINKLREEDGIEANPPGTQM